MNPAARTLLRPLSSLYGALLRARCAAYRHGFRRSIQLSIPVISVGNLTHGGTGKTPVVEAIIRVLIRGGRSPAVLTRGYGRQDKEPRVIVGPEVQIPVQLSGDEPRELAQRLPGVPIIIDHDRLRGGKKAQSLGADCVVLDDGYQHLRLRRDLNILLIDAGDPFGGTALPPKGRLREPLKGIRRADLILVTKIRGMEIPPPIQTRLRELHPRCPVHGLRLEAWRLRGAHGIEDISKLKGREVLAFAGVGRPKLFSTVLSDLGAIVMEENFFPDHHFYTSEQIRELEMKAREMGWIPVTTAKDAVKIPEMSGMYVLEVRMVPLSGQWDFLWEGLQKVRT